MEVPANVAKAISVYEAACRYVESAGFTEEVEWQRSCDFDSFSESDLLRETAWVVLCSGFRERVVRGLFDYVSLCFCDWESADAIVKSDPQCFHAARSAFKNEGKLSAILQTAYRVRRQGFQKTKMAIQMDPLRELQRFPYIGNVTACHLAKNLGFDVAKPDRHLGGASGSLGFVDAFDLCSAISRETGEPIRVVDVVIWRYLADNPCTKFPNI